MLKSSQENDGSFNANFTTSTPTEPKLNQVAQADGTTTCHNNNDTRRVSSSASSSSSSSSSPSSSHSLFVPIQRHTSQPSDANKTTHDDDDDDGAKKELTEQVDDEHQQVVVVECDTTSAPQQTSTIESNHRSIQQANSNNTQVATLNKNPGLFFDPSDLFCYWWSACVSLAFLYNFWSLSYRFAFKEIDTTSVVFWFTFDYCADLIYLCDIFINFKTGYLEDGVLQRDFKLIGSHYRDSTIFYLDLLCLLPFDVLYLSFGYFSLVRCNRLVKIHKFWSFVDRTERHTNYPNVFRTITLVHYILVIFHWNACLLHMISTSKILDIESLYKINGNQCEKDIMCQYLHAFYWSTLALTPIGDLPRPQTRSEYIYVIVELFFGLFLYASVLGYVANIVTNLSTARKEFQAKLDAVKTFMRTRRVSEELQNKVIRWFDYLWLSQKSSDEECSVACLPDRLKAEIAIHVNLDTLKRVEIFQNTEAGFLCELVLRLKPVLFSPGDYVIRKGEVGHGMYIVNRGILELVSPTDGRSLATFMAGSYFGEIAVLNVGAAGNKRTASVRSVGYSDLFCLSKQDLWDVLKDYPNAEARIRHVAEERLLSLSAGTRNNDAGGQSTQRKRRTTKTTKSSSDNKRQRLNGRARNKSPSRNSRYDPVLDLSINQANHHQHACNACNNLIISRLTSNSLPPPPACCCHARRELIARQQQQQQQQQLVCASHCNHCSSIFATHMSAHRQRADTVSTVASSCRVPQNTPTQHFGARSRRHFARVSLESRAHNNNSSRRAALVSGAAPPPVTVRLCPNHSVSAIELNDDNERTGMHANDELLLLADNELNTGANRERDKRVNRQTSNNPTARRRRHQTQTDATTIELQDGRRPHTLGLSAGASSTSPLSSTSTPSTAGAASATSKAIGATTTLTTSGGGACIAATSHSDSLPQAPGGALNDDDHDNDHDKEFRIDIRDD